MREQVDLHLLRPLNRFELVEFFYFNVIDVEFCEDRDEELTKKFGYHYKVTLEVFLAVRSIVGADCSERFNQLIAQPPVAIPKNYSGGLFKFSSLNFEEANTCLRRLICFIPEYMKERFGYKRSLDRGLPSIFHGWYCFRNWRFDFIDVDLSFSSFDFYKEFKKKFLYPYRFIFDKMGLFAVRSDDEDYEFYKGFESFLYSPHFDAEENDAARGKNHVRHKHADILGLSVASTYDSPSVLLNLVRSYCTLKEIKLIDGQLFRLINKSFLKFLGPLN